MRRKAFCLLVVVVSALSAATAHAQRWQDADLTALTGGPNAAPFPMAMAFDPAYNGMRTHYVARDGCVLAPYHTDLCARGRIHELFLAGGRWQNADLTALTGAPLSDGGLAMAFDPVHNGMRTHYLANNHIHELFLGANGRWQHADLTAMTGAPALDYRYTAVAMAFDPVWQVMRTHFFSGSHVYELYLHGGRWQYADLTAIAGGPVARPGGGITMVFDPVSTGMRTHYLADNARILELFLTASGRWQDAELSIPGAPLPSGPPYYDPNLCPSKMTFNPFTNETQAIYVSARPANHVFELFSAGGAWGYANLTAGTGAPPQYLTWTSSLGAAFDPQWNAMRVHYVAGDRGNLHVHELFYTGGSWQQADLTAIAGAALAGDGPLAMAWDPIWSGMRTHYRDADGHIHELFLPGHAS